MKSSPYPDWSVGSPRPPWQLRILSRGPPPRLRTSLLEPRPGHCSETLLLVAPHTGSPSQDCSLAECCPWEHLPQGSTDRCGFPGSPSKRKHPHPDQWLSYCTCDPEAAIMIPCCCTTSSITHSSGAKMQPISTSISKVHTLSAVILDLVHGNIFSI